MLEELMPKLEATAEALGDGDEELTAETVVESIV